jgi:predicted nucleic acid-binding protein
MKFLDANILAYAFYSNPYSEKCQDAIRQGGLTDSFSLMEAFRVIEKETGSRETAQKAIRGIMKSNVEICAVDVNTVFEAMKNDCLSIFDAVHYVSALMGNCESILTYDKDFDKLRIPREEP